MPSWDPRSYVTEALSRHITTAARQTRTSSPPSYYEAVANHLQSHEDSESIKTSLEEQSERNADTVVTVFGKPLLVVFNPRDMRGVCNVRCGVEEVIDNAVKVVEKIRSEVSRHNKNGGEAVVSQELFSILTRVRDVSLLVNNFLDPTSEEECASAATRWYSDMGKELVLTENFGVQWPKKLDLYLDSYMEAWFVDQITTGLSELKELLGGLVTYEGYSRVFGVPRESEMWKAGVCGVGVDCEKRYLGSVDLDDERPAVSTYSVPDCSSDPFGMQCATAICQSVVVAHSLASILAECANSKAALHFVHEWRKRVNPCGKELLFGFSLFFGSGKTISDLTDTTVGENDAVRLQIYDNQAQIAHAYKQIERRISYEEYALNAVMRSRSVDGAHLICENRNVQLENQMKKCFSVLPTACVAASYVGYGGGVCVSIVNSVEYSRGDNKCTLALVQNSPLYNYVFAAGSKLTLNFLPSDQDAMYESIISNYPSWINQNGNEAVFFECQGERCVTTNALKMNSTQAVFVTLESSLVGEQLFVLGQLLGEYPHNTLLRRGNSYVLPKCISCEKICPFIYTTIHKLYGTVGLVGRGCNMCSLNPPIISICCPSESCSIVLDEKNTGPQCVITFFSQTGASIFLGKSYDDLRGNIPVPASSVMSMHPDNIAFHIKGRVVQALPESFGDDVICMVAVTSIISFSGDPVILSASTEKNILDVV
ncbi:hypothetical protein DQ04_10181010 [Trypanosoma grayi]|uniref:hypothetical protein n=1 Tax=Trypanosoma grayi TaxID=71804 RepID=UPI0004F41867|nr:hypothetical protein DQ04_10181010 [Trypanosoma grayi]KEG07321.1 hypothetical protein DQ04_10181010 [Trypanosoma grayi]